jgi:hypothetical protein
MPVLCIAPYHAKYGTIIWLTAHLGGKGRCQRAYERNPLRCRRRCAAGGRPATRSSLVAFGIWRRLGTRLNTPSSQYPEMNSRTEHVNNTFHQLLRRSVVYVLLQWIGLDSHGVYGRVCVRRHTCTRNRAQTLGGKFWLSS